MPRVKIEKPNRGNPGLPHGESIYKSKYCPHVIELLFHPARLSYREIVRRLKKQYGFKTTPATLSHFKTNYLENSKYFDPKDIEEIKKKSTETKERLQKRREVLIEHTTNSIEYLQALVVEVEERTAKLKKAQEDAEAKGKFIGTFEKTISDNIMLLAKLQGQIAEITGGQDLKEIKLSIIADVMAIAAEVFIPRVPKDLKDQAIAEFKSRIREYGETRHEHQK